MGKRIRQQRRGRGTLTFRARKKAFKIALRYPIKEGEGKVVKLISSAAHTAPVALIRLDKEKFYNIAAAGVHEGQLVQIGKNAAIKPGNVLPLAQIPVGTPIYNIETFPLRGGRLVRSSGLSARIVKKEKKGVTVLLPSKVERIFPEEARASIGVIAASGRVEKPFVKAGKVWYAMRAKGKPYPLTSAVKMNIVAHPFGSGRGKRIKSKIAKRNAPPGAKVGLLRPKRTGKHKR